MPFLILNIISACLRWIILSCANILKKEQVDFVITEVGMGGRVLISTNVVDHPL